MIYNIISTSNQLWRYSPFSEPEYVLVKEVPQLLAGTIADSLCLTVDGRIYDLDRLTYVTEDDGFTGLVRDYMQDNRYIATKNDDSLHSFNYSNQQVSHWRKEDGEFRFFTSTTLRVRVIGTRETISRSSLMVAYHNGRWCRLNIDNSSLQLVSTPMTDSMPDINQVIEVRDGMIRTNDRIFILKSWHEKFDIFPVDNGFLTCGLCRYPRTYGQRLVILYKRDGMISIDVHKISEPGHLPHGISYGRTRSYGMLGVEITPLQKMTITMSDQGLQELNSRSSIIKFVRVNDKDILLLENGETYTLGDNNITRTTLPTCVW